MSIPIEACKWLFGIFLTFAVLAGCGPSTPSQSDLEMALFKQEAQFSAVIEKIEKYRSENGRYPIDLQSISDLSIPTVELPSKFKTLRTFPAHYQVARDHSFFRFTFGMSDQEDYEVHASSSYLSFEKRWKIGRHLDGFAHVEARQFGAQYQQTHSYESLRLSIFSLLEAAKSNSDFPCRNFWGDWIEEALGAAEISYRELPALPVIGETKLYTAKDQIATFAVVINRKIFRSMKTPLPYVVGIYELNKGSKVWELVQRCDSSS